MAKPRGGEWLVDEMTALRTSGVDILVSALTTAELNEVDLTDEPQTAPRSGPAVRGSFPSSIEAHPTQSSSCPTYDASPNGSAPATTSSLTAGSVSAARR
jgi:hypothetical protein